MSGNFHRLDRIRDWYLCYESTNPFTALMLTAFRWQIACLEDTLIIIHSVERLSKWIGILGWWRGHFLQMSLSFQFVKYFVTFQIYRQSQTVFAACLSLANVQFFYCRLATWILFSIFLLSLYFYLRIRYILILVALVLCRN